MRLINTPWDVILILACLFAPSFIILPMLGIDIDVMTINAIGCSMFGGYTLLLPHRIALRYSPNAPHITTAITKDLLRGWALFSLALGGAAHLLQMHERIHPLAYGLYCILGIASAIWNYHLMCSPHWGGKRFFLVGIALNSGLVIGNGRAWFQHRNDNWYKY